MPARRRGRIFWCRCRCIPARLRERGYNQSLELARSVARRFDLPLTTHAVKRVRATTPQTTLTSSERRRNVRNAFHTASDFSGKRVAIVDDVMTSGHTVNALAKCLKPRARSTWSCGWWRAHSAGTRSERRGNDLEPPGRQGFLKPSVARPRGFGLPRPVLPCTGARRRGCTLNASATTPPRPGGRFHFRDSF